MKRKRLKKSVFMCFQPPALKKNNDVRIHPNHSLFQFNIVNKKYLKIIKAKSLMVCKLDIFIWSHGNNCGVDSSVWGMLQSITVQLQNTVVHDNVNTVNHSIVTYNWRILRYNYSIWYILLYGHESNQLDPLFTMEERKVQTSVASPLLNVGMSWMVVLYWR